jgi:hypothetical protein
MSQAEAKRGTMGQQKSGMTQNNISQPGRLRPEELVPSRYAVRVGEIDVLVVSDGVLPLPTAMLGHNADPTARAAWLKDMLLRRTLSTGR